ncbi:MAG: helix-turn-helix domain-containing protein [Verrucomicrobia bacterium]|nr:helix-turn-helix domain-containing protein [Verrucomicrobiota bacterium]
MIQLSLDQSCTLREIARSVQRAPSSISRELKRTAGPTRRRVDTAPRYLTKPTARNETGAKRFPIRRARSQARLSLQGACDSASAPHSMSANAAHMARPGGTSSPG